MTALHYDVIVERVQRLGMSKNGNPKKRLHTDHGPFTTKSDSQLADAISDQWAGDLVRCTFDAQGLWLVDVEHLAGPARDQEGTTS